MPGNFKWIATRFTIIIDSRSDITSMQTRKKPKLRVTTVRVPSSLYNEAKSVVNNGTEKARSLNDFIVDSLRERLRHIREARLDAQFAEMRNDRRYQEHATKIASEFEDSDWEALRMVEGE